MACGTCAMLWDAARVATERHIAAIGKLQIATIRHDTKAGKALEIVMRKARAERVRCTEAYRTHTELHRLELVGLSA